jgi:tetratricopeptide (TPR) repeat protein
VDRTDERNAQQHMPAQPDVYANANDPMVIRQSAAGTEEPGAPGPSAQTGASGQVLVGNIPAHQAGFQPRPALLGQLNRTRQGASIVQVLTGTQGAGKTQLAAAYARARLAAGWRLVAWVNAANTGNLLTGFAAVVDALGLSDGGSAHRTADAGQAVRHWLEADGDRCLLVFDDARDPDVLRPFLPLGGAAQVLITTASESVAALGTNVRVDVFSAEETLALLDGRTGLADRAGAAAVAAELGYLPLALDQAAAMIAGQHLEYRSYLDRLRARPVQDHLTGLEKLYPRGTPEAMLLSIDAVRTDDPAGVCSGVMQIMAVLSAAGVRRELIHAAGQAGVLAVNKRRSQVSAAVVDRALSQLAERSLLAFSLDGQTVIAHQLVLMVVRGETIQKGRLPSVCRAVASVLDTYSDMLAGSPDRMAVRDIPAQVAGLCENVARYVADADDGLIQVLLSIRLWALYHLNDLGDSAPLAITIGESLVVDSERILGPDHPDTLNSRNSLALAYLAAGRAADAIPFFEAVLVDQERLLGSDHPHTLTSQINLATAYRNVGRTAEAILLLKLTLATQEGLLGPDHPDALNTGNNLATAYLTAGRPTDAILLLELILPAREWLLGPDHQSTTNTRRSLASAYLAAGRPAAAIPLLEQTLAIWEGVLGPDHPDTNDAQHILASAYREAGRVVEAIPLVERILAVRERVLGADHLKTLGSRNNLATAYREAGRPAEAIPLHERTLAASERILGPDHPKTLDSRNNLATAYREAGRPAEAIPLLERTLAVRERLLGADDPTTQAARANLTLAFQEAGRAE